MTKKAGTNEKRRVAESGTLLVAESTGKVPDRFRIRLISEGQGSRAYYPREFFNEVTAEALADSLSFPGHPRDIWSPEQRDPFSAIGRVDTVVTIEEGEDGKLAFWSDLIPESSKPHIAEFLQNNHDKLGISIYGESVGYFDAENDRWTAVGLVPDDPYMSVDVVIAPGARGGFERRVAESLYRLAETSAKTAEEKEDIDMKELEDLTTEVKGLKTIVEGLVSVKTAEAAQAAQVEADDTAVEKAVESRFAHYDQSLALIAEAKLTESQTAELRGRAAKGEDIAPLIEREKKVLAEAAARFKTAESGTYLGGGDNGTGASGFDPMSAVPGFGKVS